MKKQHNSTTPKDIDLKPRPIFFEFKELPQYWIDNCPAKTHFWNSLSTVLPHTEHWVIQNLRRVKDGISDEKLKHEAQVFCGQEAHHARNHAHFNKLLEARGYKLFKKMDPKVEKIFDFMTKRFSPRFNLAMNCAIEHLVTSLSYRYLENPDCWAPNPDPEVIKLWHWHAVEEVEHKSVSHDVYMHLYGDYWRRIVAYLFFIFLLFTPSMLLRQMSFYKTDGILFKFSTWKRFFKYQFGKGGMVRTLWGDFFSYFNPKFTPWDDADGREYIKDWVENIEPGLTESGYR